MRDSLRPIVNGCGVMSAPAVHRAAVDSFALVRVLLFMVVLPGVCAGLLLRARDAPQVSVAST